MLKKDNKELLIKLSAVSIPIMLQSLVQSGLGFLDTLMIGQLGENEVAAIGGANQFFFFIQLAFFGLNSGGCIFLAQYYGAKNYKGMRKMTTFVSSVAMAIGAVGCLVVSLFPSALMSIFSDESEVISPGVIYLRTIGISYLFTGFSMIYSGAFRSSGDAKTPMATTIISLILNGILNALLIFGLGPFPALGVFGGALATVISRLTEALMLIAISIKRRSPFLFKEKSDFNWDKDFIFSFCKTAFPAFAHETLWSIGSILYKVAYSSLGTATFAATNIDMSIQDLFFVAGLGLANGSGIILGNTIGEGEKDKSLRWGKKLVSLTLFIGVIMSLLGFSLSSTLTSLYNIPPETKNIATKALYSIFLTLPLEMVGVTIMVGVLRSGGDSKFSMLSEIIPMYLLSIPLVFFGSYVLKLPLFLILLFKISEIIPKVTAGIIRVYSGKWIKDLSSIKR